MAPKNKWLENETSFWDGLCSDSMLVSRSVNIQNFNGAGVVQGSKSGLRRHYINLNYTRVFSERMGIAGVCVCILNLMKFDDISVIPILHFVRFNMVYNMHMESYGITESIWWNIFWFARWKLQVLLVEFANGTSTVTWRNSQTNISQMKINPWKRGFPLHTIILTVHVSFRGRTFFAERFLLKFQSLHWTNVHWHGNWW